MNTLDIIIWNVQHGSAVFINTPNNKTIVQDLGIGNISTGNDAFSPLKHIYNKHGIKGLDQLIITHPDLDHIEDILNLNLFPNEFKYLYRPHSIKLGEIREKISISRTSREKKIFYEYINICEKYCTPVNYNNNPLIPQNNGGVDFKIFTPSPDVKTHRINNHSLINIITYAGTKIILPGDNEPISWQWLIENHYEQFVNAVKGTDILLAPHHGRESGYCNNIFSFFKPSITLISDEHNYNTSASSKYSSISKGHKVFHRNNGSSIRKCITTRKDGVILLRLGFNSYGKPFREIFID